MTVAIFSLKILLDFFSEWSQKIVTNAYRVNISQCLANAYIIDPLLANVGPMRHAIWDYLSLIIMLTTMP